VSSGLPHMHTSNQRGRGNDPVVVLGKIKSFVAVNIYSPRLCSNFPTLDEDGSMQLQPRLASCP